MKTILRKKTHQTENFIYFNEYNFFGFIGRKKGFINKWWDGLIPFAKNKAAWHFLGFRFTKTPKYVSTHRNEVNGWYTTDSDLINKLRNL